MAGKAEFFGIDVNKAPGADLDLELAKSVFEVMRPKASPFPLIRLGGTGDGAYLVPDDFDGVVGCFSPGVSKSKLFEDSLADQFGIRSHLCDYSADVSRLSTPMKAGMQTFEKKWLDVSIKDDSITLDDWVSRLEPEGDLILQMDIEGAEYRNILAVSDVVFKRFRVIILEVHKLEKMLDPAVLSAVLAPFFTRIGNDFACVHAHPNNVAKAFNLPGTNINIPSLMELTFLRKDRLAEKATTYKPMLPHKLDISRNLKRMPPLFLGREWMYEDPDLETRLELLERKLDYLEFDLDRKNKADQSAKIYELFARSLQTLTAKQTAKARQANDKVELVDVAAGCEITLTGIRSKSKSGVVEPSETCFFETDQGYLRSIQVKLNKPADIAKLIIHNRKDRFFNRARGLFCILSMNPDFSVGKVIPIVSPADFLDGTAPELVVNIPVTRARFVTICSVLDTMLHFSDLKIMALPAEAQKARAAKRKKPAPKAAS